MVNSHQKWNDHVTAITSKAGKRNSSCSVQFSWLIKQLRRAGVCQDDEAVVRPVLEYASPCWQASLTKDQMKQLDDVQRRALRVIFGKIPYDEARCCVVLDNIQQFMHGLIIIKTFILFGLNHFQ